MIRHLRTSFAELSNPHSVTFTVLESSPKRTSSLFPYTTQHPRCFQVDYLVTLSCEADVPSSKDHTDAGKPANGTSRRPDGQEESNGPSSDPKEKKRVLTTALSAHLYILPQHRSSILYISKLDSSGYPTVPLPLTRTFITSVLSYFTLPASRPTPHVRIQLFARSQGQYLFPNSSGGPKKVLGGLGLCGWWKGVYEDVAATAQACGTVRLGMVLPGYSADEAKGMLRQRKPLAEGLEWTSSPPFMEPLPSASASHPSTAQSSGSSLANLIPSFPDDPKARFLDDLVSDGAEDPARRRKLLGPRGEAGGSSSPIGSSSSNSASKRADAHRAKAQAEDEAERRFTQATLERVSKEEYWERMGFRQECISGDVTGFFSLESTLHSADAIDNNASTAATADPKPAARSLPPEIIERLLAALLNTDFGNLQSGIDHTAIWERSVKSVVTDEIGAEGYEACIATLEGKPDTQSAAGQPIKRKEEAVTVLQVRKKKKVA